MVRHKCCPADHRGTFPVFGPGFSRRRFFEVAGTGIVGSYFADVLNPPRRVEAQTAPSLLKSARNVVLIFLSGAPSHTDTWDLKEGTWTPTDFAPATFLGNIRFPQGLMPKTANHLGQVAIVRSGLSWALVHGLAQRWAQVSRNPAGVLGDVAPHIGSVAALELQASRAPADVLPSFIALNATPSANQGYFPAAYAPFRVGRPSANGLASLAHPEGAARLADRWGLIRSLDPDRAPGQPLAKNAADMDGFYAQAKALIDAPNVNALFGFTSDEHNRYGATSFGDSLVVARNLLSSNRGTRFVQVTLGGWDHHSNIYAKNAGSLFGLSAQFDSGFAALLDDLAARPGAAAGKTLFDETLVVVLGEFGRTVGGLNGNGGRDHFLRMSIVFAGGGVKGGRVIGQTDARGDKVVDTGWAPNRDVRPEDVAATIYSSLGIDYTTVRTDDPVGRGFSYVPYAKEGIYQPIVNLF
jgi:hypothetical protein